MTKLRWIFGLWLAVMVTLLLADAARPSWPVPAAPAPATQTAVHCHRICAG
jgi:hypothetical protein